MALTLEKAPRPYLGKSQIKTTYKYHISSIRVPNEEKNSEQSVYNTYFCIKGGGVGVRQN